MFHCIAYLDITGWSLLSALESPVISAWPMRVGLVETATGNFWFELLLPTLLLGCSAAQLTLFRTDSGGDEGLMARRSTENGVSYLEVLGIDSEYFGTGIEKVDKLGLSDASSTSGYALMDVCIY